MLLIKNLLEVYKDLVCLQLGVGEAYTPPRHVTV